MESPIHWYHVVTAMGVPVTAVLAIWWRVDAMFIKPTKEWRKSTEEEQAAIRKEFELYKQKTEMQLASGDKKFEALDALNERIHSIEQTLARIEGKMTNSVWQGVGNPDASTKR